MARQLWEDPYAKQSTNLLQDPARARAYAVEKVGEAQARAAETTGNANANAQLQSGAAWAQGIQGVGNAVAAIHGQIMVAQQQSRQAAMQKLQIDQLQRQNNAADRLEETKRNIGALMSDSSLINEDGTFNGKGILAKLSGSMQNGASGPVQAPDPTTVFGIIDPINESLMRSRKLEQEFNEHKTNTIAQLAGSILAIGKPTATNPQGSYLDAAQLGLAAAVKSGVVTQEQANSFLVPMVENPAATQGMLQAIAARSTLKKETPTEASLAYAAAGGDQQAAGAMNILKPPVARVPTEASIANDLSSPDPAVRARAETAMAALKPKPDATERRSLDVQAAEALAKGDTETYNRLLKVKKEMGQADDRPRVTVMNTGPNNNLPGDWDKSGKEFLDTVPAQWRKTVEKIANYDEDPTKVASMRSGMRETLMQWVNQVNPAYDASQFTNRAPTRKAFTTGTQGQQINAINTAIGHIDQLGGLVEQLGNGSFTPGNKVWNQVATILGSDKVTNFDTLKSALSGEVASVLSKSGATVAGIKEAEAKMSSANSPDQLLGYVKTQIPVMGSKLASLDYQFHQAMGPNDSFSALSPDSKRILTRMGFDPAHPEIGTVPAGNPFGATSPNPFRK